MNIKHHFSDPFYLLSIVIHLIICIAILWGVRVQKIKRIPTLKVSLLVESAHNTSPLKKIEPLKITKPIKKDLFSKKKILPSTSNENASISTLVKKKESSRKTLNSSGFLKGNELTKLGRRLQPLPAVTPKITKTKKPILEPIENRTLKPKSTKPALKDVLTPNLREQGFPQKKVASLSWLKDAEQKTYKKLLQNRIAEHWRLPPVSSQMQDILISLTISSKGKLLSIHLRQKSGLTILDISAYQAVLRSIPLPLPPKKMLKNDNTAEFIFRFSITGQK